MGPFKGPKNINARRYFSYFIDFIEYRLFPSVKQGIYLDADLVVKGDIASLWKEVVQHKTVISAVKR